MLESKKKHNTKPTDLKVPSGGEEGFLVEIEFFLIIKVFRCSNEHGTTKLFFIRKRSHSFKVELETKSQSTPLKCLFYKIKISFFEHFFLESLLNAIIRQNALEVGSD